MEKSYRRIHVIGNSGSGKTYLSKIISKTLSVKHIESDSIWWQKNWEVTPYLKFQSQMKKILSNEEWVLDGNYLRLYDDEEIRKKVQVLIWIDLPLYIILYRIILRTFKRVITKEKLWGKNTETFRMNFFSKDSIILYVIKVHHNNRKNILKLINHPDNKHIKVIKLNTKTNVNEFINEI
ncbi:MAG: adenylate kinase [Chloroflexi bacterium]|nr:adenylate kinase [Chloroflexota bacterium]